MSLFVNEKPPVSRSPVVGHINSIKIQIDISIFGMKVFYGLYRCRTFLRRDWHEERVEIVDFFVIPYMEKQLIAFLRICISSNVQRFDFFQVGFLTTEFRDIIIVHMKQSKAYLILK